ncbi:hypothetical protein K7X08_018956 [Anisodus acutangulus]|uniref:Uncharacterized protein n=1 Tax=Anisodus acutangulus TaxID=402998 RepID=A0A9Q1R9E6_9SOLA|nr:hypothetical protein K7X08_018956 [Anisodus acutangulus]
MHLILRFSWVTILDCQRIDSCSVLCLWRWTEAFPGLFLLPELTSPGLLLCFCCVISSFLTSFSYELISKIFLSEYITRLPKILELYCLVSAAAFGIIGFFTLLLLYFSRYKLEQKLNIDDK